MRRIFFDSFYGFRRPVPRRRLPGSPPLVRRWNRSRPRFRPFRGKDGRMGYCAARPPFSKNGMPFRRTTGNIPFQHLSGQLFRSGESVENGRYVERAQGRQHFVVGFDTVQDNRQPASAGDLQLPNQPFALCRSVDRYGVVEPDFADRRAGQRFELPQSLRIGFFAVPRVDARRKERTVGRHGIRAEPYRPQGGGVRFFPVRMDVDKRVHLRKMISFAEQR